MACTEFATLSNGAKMPLLGYGTWLNKGAELEAGLDHALAQGYRHIDSSPHFENQDVVGKVLQERWLGPGKLRREDLFVSTKLLMPGLRPGGPAEFLDKALAALRLDSVDLYMVHSPFAPGNNNIDHIAVWKEMEALVDAGRAKAIGLANFNRRQLQLVLDNCRIRPVNLQVELHVYMQQRPLVDFCHKQGVVVTAYGPLGSPGTPAFVKKQFGVDKVNPDLFSDPTVMAVARKHGRQPAQVMLKHILRRGVAAIPKSSTKERIALNARLSDFELDADDVRQLDALDRGRDGRNFNFAVHKENKEHPHYPFHEYP